MVWRRRTPYADSLWRTAHTWFAKSVVPSITLPRITQCFAPSDGEALRNRQHFPLRRERLSSILDVLPARAAYSYVYSWGELRDLCAPESLDLSLLRAPRDGEDVDAILAEIAAETLVREQPDFTFLYMQQTILPGTTRAGCHARIWTRSRRWIAQDIPGSAGSGGAAHATFLLLADHGGNEHTHTGDVPGSDHPLDHQRPRDQTRL